MKLETTLFALAAVALATVAGCATDFEPEDGAPAPAAEEAQGDDDAVDSTSAALTKTACTTSTSCDKDYCCTTTECQFSTVIKCVPALKLAR